MKGLITALMLLLSVPVSAETLKLDYEGFTVWLDCDRRGPVRFQYNAQRDSGNHKRKSSFYIDKNVPEHCQQTSVKSYKADGQRYDRGHLVPANHLDYSKTAIKQTNFMTNILPQAANMNRGAWLRTEEIVECYRDRQELLVMGGVLWGNDNSDDFFLDSHGVETPFAFWKVIIKGDDVISWIVPNSQGAKRKMLDSYLVPISEIEQLTGVNVPVNDNLKDFVPNKSWGKPKSCDLS